MRRFLIFLIALLVIGSASALPMFGPHQGFYNPGNVEIGGTLSIGGVDIANGSVSYDALLAAMIVNETAINSSIVNLTIAAYTNETAINSSIANLTIAAYTNETAINTTIAAMPGSLIDAEYGLKNESGVIIVNLTADKGLEFGTGAALGGLQIEAGDGIDLSSNGIAVDVTDIIYTSEGLYEQGTNNIAINLTEDGGLGFGTGADSGALIVYPYSGLKTTANGLELNYTANKGLEIGTGAAEGALQIELDGTSLQAGSSGLKVNATETMPLNASTSITTVLTAANMNTVFPMDGSAGHVTLTLPDAAKVPGRVYVIVLAADMGGNNVIVDTTGAGNLGGTSGPDSLTTSDAAAALTVLSDGTNYLIVNKDGSWS